MTGSMDTLLPGARSPATILIVDDEIYNRMLLEVLLQPEGYLTQSVASGEEALASIAVRTPDLILLDIMMPGMDGYQLASQLKSNPATASIPIIMLTAQTDRSARLAGLNAGAEEFLTKPVDRAELWGRVRNLLRLKALADFLQNHNLILEQQVQVRTADLRASELRFRQMAENIHDVFFLFDTDSNHFSYVSPAYEEIWGLSCESLYAHPESWAEAVHPDDRAATYEIFKRGMLAGAFKHEYRIVRSDDSIRWMEARGFSVRDHANTLIGIAGIATDITERKEAENRIRHLNRVYALLSGINTLIVRALDRDELFTAACRIAVEIGAFKIAWIGVIDPQTLDGRVVAWHGDENDYVDQIKLTARDGMPESEYLACRALRQLQPFISNDIATDYSSIQFRDELLTKGYKSVGFFPLSVSGRPEGVIALFADEPNVFDDEEMRLLVELAGDLSFALDHIEKAKRLNYLAYYDVLTGLPSRTLFYDRLEQGTKAALRTERPLAVMFLDLDHFKTVNDNLGHTIGDKLLQEVTRRLTACLRDTDTLGRLGGDEFGIILPEIGSSEDAAAVASQLIECCALPYQIEDHELFVSASVGITLFPDDALSHEILISNADTAMYRAKCLGRNTYQFYTAEMNRNAQDKQRLEQDLRHAMEKGEFLLYYQPKVSCSSGKITGFEALLRWQHPLRGLVGPIEFIPILEETGLIVLVGEWVLNSACVQAKRWHDEGLGVPSMAVNVSGRQIQVTNLCETVLQALATSGLAPASLELELTESQMMKDAENIIGLLRRLKAIGLKISVDDFGTGYSSLAYLKRFPIDCLKVDQTFVRDIIADPNDVSITRAIISLAHNLKLKVVAEGVETAGQLGLLIANHCDEIQGYYFSRPLPAEEATRLLRTGQSLDSQMMACMQRS